MGVLGESSWCFCSGGGRSERVKAGIFSGKGPAMAWLPGGGTGFLIHRGLLLTTHVSLPSVAAAEAAEIQIHQGRVSARLVPHRFFITSTVLDLTIVGLDTLETDSSSQAQQPHYLKTCCSPSLELGNIVYLLGHTEKKELMVGEGKVVIATDNLIKLSTDGVTWSPGSAGFDVHGNLAFMVCDPMRLATSPTAKSSSASSASSNSGKDLPMQFGIPIPIICDWLYQHWEGSLDELSKPKLPLIRLMSTGQKSENSCASFTMRQVFKLNEAENEDMPSSSQIISRPRQQLGSICSPNANAGKEHSPLVDLRSSHEQGIPTPEIYETRKMVSGPLRKKEQSPVQLLDINFPPRAPRTAALPLPLKQLPTEPNENDVEDPRPAKTSREVEISPEMRPTEPEEYAELSPPCPAPADCHSEVESSASPLEVSVPPNEGDGFSSEGETMFSAETMESRNFPSPKQHRPQQVGRSQSCMSYNRWSATPTPRSSAAGKLMLQKQHSLTPVRKTHSQTAAMSHKSHDYYSPTVSSIMKKRNNSEPRSRPRQSVAQVSPRWMF